MDKKQDRCSEYPRKWVKNDWNLKHRCLEKMEADMMFMLGGETVNIFKIRQQRAEDEMWAREMEKALTELENLYGDK